jgi:hypothetical protein
VSSPTPKTNVVYATYGVAAILPLLLLSVGATSVVIRRHRIGRLA